MSIAVSHPRHHVHVPWMPIIAVLVAAVVAAGVLVLVNQPTTSTVGESTIAIPVAAVGAAAVALPETPALRHQLAEGLAARVPQEQQFAYPRNHVQGATLSAVSTAGLSGVQLGAQAAPIEQQSVSLQAAQLHESQAAAYQAYVLGHNHMSPTE